MPSSCDIEFDHPNDVYYSGQNLNGKIRLITQSTKTIRGVHITINGYAKVKWDERRTRTVNGKSQSYTVHFTAHDQYLNSRTYVAGTEGGNLFEFPPGDFIHTFYCPLPLTLPTSVTGKYGEIKYEVIVTIDRPFRFDNVFKRAFTVIQELNLNVDPTYREMRCISVTLTGYGKVKWLEKKSRKKNGKTQHYEVIYSSFRSYLNYQTFMLGSLGGEQFELLSGIYEHTIAHQLPIQLPTSVIGRYGIIQYEIVVIIDRPFCYNNIFKKAFTVIHEQDLNLDVHFRTPKHAVDEKEYCCTCCCFGGPGTVNTKLSIPFGGYAPGQKINFSLEVANESSNDLDQSKIKLEKCITFESRHPSVKHKYSTFKLDSKYFPPVLRNSRKKFDDYLEIPSVPPSSTLAGACVRISYKIYAKIETGCCHSNINLEIPIVIGTIPLIESATNPDSVITQQPTAPQTLDGTTGGDSPPGYKIAAPPSYEDATATALDSFVDNEKDDKHQEAPFVPKYPVYYNFAQPPLPNSITNGHSSNMTPENRPSTSTTYGWAPN